MMGDFFSSPVTRNRDLNNHLDQSMSWIMSTIDCHSHWDHWDSTPFQVDAMTWKLTTLKNQRKSKLQIFPALNIIQLPGEWLEYTPPKINHRTWFLMLGKMIFLFQGKNFLRFQPLSFRGDTHVMLSFPFWPSAVNVLVCTRLPWLFGSNKNFNKHRETPKHMTSRKQQKERLNYPGPMIFKWYLYIPLFIFIIIYISIYQHVESSNTAITWANWPKESPTLCWCRAGFAQAIVAAGSNLTLGEYRDEYDDHQLISLVIGATFPWICHDPGTLKLT